MIFEKTLPADRQTVLTAKCVAVVNQERNRIKRVKAWAEKQQAALNSNS